MSSRTEHLLSEAAQEWNRLLGEVQEVRSALGVSAVLEALSDAGIRVDKEAQEVVFEPCDCETVEVTQVGARAGGLDINVVETVCCEAGDKVSTVVGRTTDELSSAELSVETGYPRVKRHSRAEELYEKISDLMSLLKEDLSVRKVIGQSTELQSAQRITKEIAHEVAGRIRESILHGMASCPRDTSLPSRLEQASETKVRIPIGDIASMIDQLNKR